MKNYSKLLILCMTVIAVAAIFSTTPAYAGIIGGVFDAVGQVLSFPFRVVGEGIRAIF